jgi:hypothetical protein
LVPHASDILSYARGGAFTGIVGEFYYRCDDVFEAEPGSIEDDGVGGGLKGGGFAL